MTGLSVKLAKTYAVFVRDESGATSIEYALIGTGIGLTIMVTVEDFVATMNTMYNMISDRITASIS